MSLPHSTSPLALRSAPMARAYAALRFLEEIKADEIRNPLPVEDGGSRSRSRSRGGAVSVRNEGVNTDDNLFVFTDKSSRFSREGEVPNDDNLYNYGGAPSQRAVQQQRREHHNNDAHHSNGFGFSREEHGFRIAQEPADKVFSGGASTSHTHGPKPHEAVNHPAVSNRDSLAAYYGGGPSTLSRALGADGELVRGPSPPSSPLAQTRSPALTLNDDAVAVAASSPTDVGAGSAGAPPPSTDAALVPSSPPNGRRVSSPQKRAAVLPDARMPPRLTQHTASSAMRVVAGSSRSTPTSPIRGGTAKTTPPRTHSSSSLAILSSSATDAAHTPRNSYQGAAARGLEPRRDGMEFAMGEFPTTDAFAPRREAPRGLIAHRSDLVGALARAADSISNQPAGERSRHLAVGAGSSTSRASSPISQQPHVREAKDIGDGSNGAHLSDKSEHILEAMLKELVHLRKDTQKALLEVADLKRKSPYPNSSSSTATSTSFSRRATTSVTTVRNNSPSHSYSKSVQHEQEEVSQGIDDNEPRPMPVLNTNNKGSRPTYIRSLGPSDRYPHREPFDLLSLRKSDSDVSEYVADHRARVKVPPVKTAPLGHRDPWDSTSTRRGGGTHSSALGVGRRSTVTTPTQASIARRDQTLQQRVELAAAKERALAEEETQLASKHNPRRRVEVPRTSSDSSPRRESNSNTDERSRVNEWIEKERRIVAVPISSGGDDKRSITDLNENQLRRSITPRARGEDERTAAPVPTPLKRTNNKSSNGNNGEELPISMQRASSREKSTRNVTEAEKKAQPLSYTKRVLSLSNEIQFQRRSTSSLSTMPALPISSPARRPKSPPHHNSPMRREEGKEWKPLHNRHALPAHLIEERTDEQRGNENSASATKNQTRRALSAYDDVNDGIPSPSMHDGEKNHTTPPRILRKVRSVKNDKYTVAGVFDPRSGREIPLPPPSGTLTAQREGRSLRSGRHAESDDDGELSTPSVSFIQGRKQDHRPNARTDGKNNIDEVGTRGVSANSESAIRMTDDDDDAIASLSPLSESPAMTRRGEPSRSPTHRDDDLVDTAVASNTKNEFKNGAQTEPKRTRDDEDEGEESKPRVDDTKTATDHDDAYSRGQPLYLSTSQASSLPQQLEALCYTAPPLWVSDQLKRMLSHVASTDLAAEGRHWLLATALINTPPFITHIIVPMLMEELSERPPASFGGAASSSASNISSADQQRRQQLLCALVGLGGAAEAALPYLMADLVLGSGDSKLVAMAIRSVGGVLAVEGLCAVVRGSLPHPSADDGDQKNMAKSLAWVFSVLHARVERKQSSSLVSNGTTASQKPFTAVRVSAKARCVAAYALGLMPLPVVARTSVCLLASDRLRGKMSLMRPAPKDEPLAGEGIDKLPTFSRAVVGDDNKEVEGDILEPMLLSSSTSSGSRSREASEEYLRCHLQSFSAAASLIENEAEGIHMNDTTDTEGGSGGGGGGDIVVRPRPPSYRTTHIFLDFEAMLHLMISLLDSRPEVVEEWRRRRAKGAHQMGKAGDYTASTLTCTSHDIIHSLRDFLVYSPDVHKNLLAMTMGPTPSAVRPNNGFAEQHSNPLRALDVSDLAEMFPAVLLDTNGLLEDLIPRQNTMKRREELARKGGYGPLACIHGGRTVPYLRGGDWASLLVVHAGGREGEEAHALSRLVANTLVDTLVTVAAISAANPQREIIQPTTTTTTTVSDEREAYLLCEQLCVTMGLMPPPMSREMAKPLLKLFDEEMGNDSSCRSTGLLKGGGASCLDISLKESRKGRIDASAAASFLIAVGTAVNGAVRHGRANTILARSRGRSSSSHSLEKEAEEERAYFTRDSLYTFSSVLQITRAVDNWRLRHACCIGIGLSAFVNGGDTNERGSGDGGETSAIRQRVVKLVSGCMLEGALPPALSAWALSRLGVEGVDVLCGMLRKPHLSIVMRVASARALGGGAVVQMAKSAYMFSRKPSAVDHRQTRPSEAVAVTSKVTEALLEAIESNCRSAESEALAAEAAVAVGKLLGGQSTTTEPTNAAERMREASSYYKEVPVSPVVTRLAPLLGVRPDMMQPSAVRGLMRSLAEHGGPHGEVLVGQWLLQSDYVSVRQAAAFGIRFRGPCVVRALCSALGDPSAEVRAEALASLEYLGMSGIFAVLARRPEAHSHQVLSSLKMIVENARALPVNSGGLGFKSPLFQFASSLIEALSAAVE